MIDGSEKRKRQLGFELQNSCVFEKRSKRMGSHIVRIWIALGCFSASFVLWRQSQDSDRGQTITAQKPDQIDEFTPKNTGIHQK